MLPAVFESVEVEPDDPIVEPVVPLLDVPDVPFEALVSDPVPWVPMAPPAVPCVPAVEPELVVPVSFAEVPFELLPIPLQPMIPAATSAVASLIFMYFLLGVVAPQALVEGGAAPRAGTAGCAFRDRHWFTCTEPWTTLRSIGLWTC